MMSQAITSKNVGKLYNGARVKKNDPGMGNCGHPVLDPQGTKARRKHNGKSGKMKY
jgi:hypothetical protein